MKKIIVLIIFFYLNIYANTYFIDFTLNNSIIQNTTEYNYKKNSENYYYEGGSNDGGFYGFNLNIGYSFKYLQKMVIEPSFGIGSLSNGAGTNINKIYFIELPVLKYIENKKYGFFIKYNYLTDISMSGISEEIIQLKNQKTFSLGFKTIVENRNIDFILSYEYMLPGIYEETIQKGNETINTKYDIEGSFLAFGIRFKF